MTQRQQVILTIEEAQALMAEWQEVLRLQDWTITLMISRGNGLDIPQGNQGHCDMVFRRKEGRIQLLDPIDFPKNTSSPQDMEVTLVHELLHFHFVGFDRRLNEDEQDLSEHAVNALSYALVGLKRKAQTS